MLQSMENFVRPASLYLNDKWTVFSQTLTKLEDRKIKINGKKVTLAILNWMLNSRGNLDLPVGGAKDRNMIWVRNGRGRSLQLLHLQNH